MSILTEPGWAVTDGEPELLVSSESPEGEELEGADLADYLNSPVPEGSGGERWEPDAECYINLHFTDRISGYDPNDPEAPEILAYPFNDLRTVGQVLGAIHTYYTTPLTLEELRNVSGLSSGNYGDVIQYLNQNRYGMLPLPNRGVTVADLYSGHQLEGLEPTEETGHYMVYLGD
jgi:hypothetical protein